MEDRAYDPLDDLDLDSVIYFSRIRNDEGNYCGVPFLLEDACSFPVQLTNQEDYDMNAFNRITDPFSGGMAPVQFTTGESEADEWDSFRTVNDPSSGKSIPNEGHAADDEDEWDSYRTVNDPSSGKSIPNEGHAMKKHVEATNSSSFQGYQMQSTDREARFPGA